MSDNTDSQRKPFYDGKANEFTEKLLNIAKENGIPKTPENNFYMSELMPHIVASTFYDKEETFFKELNEHLRNKQPLNLYPFVPLMGDNIRLAGFVEHIPPSLKSYFTYKKVDVKTYWQTRGKTVVGFEEKSDNTDSQRKPFYDGKANEFTEKLLNIAKENGIPKTPENNFYMSELMPHIVASTFYDKEETFFKELNEHLRNKQPLNLYPFVPLMGDNIRLAGFVEHIPPSLKSYFTYKKVDVETYWRAREKTVVGFGKNREEPGVGCLSPLLIKRRGCGHGK